MKGATEKATFGGGCFWHVETAFRGVPGVVSACVGYMGGTLENPTYEDVCTGLMGYAEVVYVEYDPASVSYEELLDLLWQIHDPTTLNRLGSRRRHTVPVGYLLSQRRAGNRGKRVQVKGAAAFRTQGSYGNHTGLRVLSSGGVSSTSRSQERTGL